jgi:streptogramin lyase
MTTYTKLFRSPYAVPNGLQMTDDGLWIVDQITDRVMLVERAGEIDYYGVPKMIRDIKSDSSNTSGMAWGEGSLWLAANGSADMWRGPRTNDARKSMGEILRVDPTSGETISRHPLPNGGGTHGIEYDNIESGHLWLTTLKNQTLSKVRISDWSVQHVIPLPYQRAHGVVRVEDGVWVVHTGVRVIVKLSVADGAELERITVPPSEPEPHGLSVDTDNRFLYCDASSGWVVAIGES